MGVRVGVVVAEGAHQVVAAPSPPRPLPARACARAYARGSRAVFAPGITDGLERAVFLTMLLLSFLLFCFQKTRSFQQHAPQTNEG